VSTPPTRGWWGEGDPPWVTWPGVSIETPCVPVRQPGWVADRWESPCGAYWFDPDAVQRFVDFGRLFVRHVKGEWAGEPFDLLPWQNALVFAPLFGWKRKRDGYRRFRVAFVEVAKKNGKSALASMLALYLLTGDGEPGAEVYSAAADETQARIVYGDAAMMAAGSPALIDQCGVQVMRASIQRPSRNATYRALSRAPGTKHGFNVHGLLFDEFHTQKSRELWETLSRGVSARRQPVTLVITTAGSDRESICYEMHERAIDVIEGKRDDPTMLPVVFRLPAEADWTDESVWPLANPSLGVTKKIDYMREACAAAQAEARARNSFLNLDLNVWTESRTAWIAPEAWAECRRETEPTDLADLTCCVGIDLSETTDLTAVVAAFRRPLPDVPAPVLDLDEDEDHRDKREERKTLLLDFAVDLRCWFFLPGDGLRERVQRDRVPYDVWAREGWLTLIDGPLIDYRQVRQVILRDIARPYNVHEVGIDPYNGRQLAAELMEDGLSMVEVRQGFLTLSAPSKLLEGLIAARRITHDGNPVMRWCAANVEVATGPSGLIKPVKPGGEARSTRRIDGVVATIIALSRLMLAREVEQPSVSWIHF